MTCTCTPRTLDSCPCGWKAGQGLQPVLVDTGTVRLDPIIDDLPDNQMADGASGLESIAAVRYTNPPRFRIYHSTTQNVPAANAGLEVTFNSELYDSHNGHSGTDNRFYIVPLDGLWKVGFSIRFASTTQADRIVTGRLFVNRDLSVLNRLGWMAETAKGNASFTGVQATPTAPPGNHLNMETEAILQTNDVLSLQAIWSGTGTMAVGSADANQAPFCCTMWGQWIGDAEAAA